MAVTVIVGMTVIVLMCVIVGMIVLMCVVVRMLTFGAMTRVFMPRFACVARRRARACRRRIRLTGTRPKTLHQRASRQENMDHGRFLPKVTESLDSL